VALFTYERFLSLITSNNNTSILSLFSALVVDELQLISDEERGPGEMSIILPGPRSSSDIS